MFLETWTYMCHGTCRAAIVWSIVTESDVRFADLYDRGPVQRLADELGEPSKRQKIASWVARARREGWLTSAVPGRAGADPGPRLIKWLEANVE